MIDTRESDGLVAVATCGNGVFTGNFEPAASVRQSPTHSSMEVLLEPNIPNPFADKTTIHFKTFVDAPVSLRVLDVFGKTVCTLLDNVIQSGEHTVNWSGGPFPSGIYYYQISTLDKIEMAKMILSK